MTANKEELEKLYYKEELTMKEIGKLYDCSKGTVWKWFQKYNLKARKMVGKNHGRWKGGRTNKGDGYIGIHKPKHQKADKSGYVFEHTLVIEKENGRLPKNNEVIHHINLDKKDNSPENLYLCTYKEHSKLHRAMEGMIKELLKGDIIYFDREEGEYKLRK
jgi:hypothetical protein